MGFRKEEDPRKVTIIRDGYQCRGENINKSNSPEIVPQPSKQYKYLHKRFILPNIDSKRLSKLLENNLNEWANDGWKVANNIIRERPKGHISTEPSLGSEVDVVYFDVLFEKEISTIPINSRLVCTHIPSSTVDDSSNMYCPNCKNPLFKEDYEIIKETRMITKICDACNTKVIFRIDKEL